jgi:hypothetical protein
MLFILLAPQGSSRIRQGYGWQDGRTGRMDQMDGNKENMLILIVKIYDLRWTQRIFSTG